jgi:hypothetical protein
MEEEQWRSVAAVTNAQRPRRDFDLGECETFKHWSLLVLRSKFTRLETARQEIRDRIGRRQLLVVLLGSGWRYNPATMVRRPRI